MKSVVQVFMLFYLAFALSAHASDAGLGLSLSCQGCGVQAPSGTVAVFPLDTARVEATAVIPGREKRKAAFTWYGPDGSARSHIEKLAFPSGKGDKVSVKDGIGRPGQTGWWRVEAVSGDVSATRTFFVTSDVRILVIAHGTVADKVSALHVLDGSSPGGRDALTIAMADKEPVVRREAVNYAARSGVDWASGYIGEGAKDPSPDVRSAAYKALISKGGDTGRNAAAMAAEDPAPQVRADAARTLGTKDEPWAVDKLGLFISDCDPVVRTAALSSLSRHEGDAVIPLLARGFGVDDPVFRRNVVGVLLESNATGIYGVLAGLLGDQDPEIRHKALSALAGYEGVWPRESVVPLLDDPDENSALTSSCILSGAGHEDAMITALGSRHVSVRRVALDYLVEKGGDAAARGLAIAVSDKAPEIRHHALDRLTGIGKAGMPGLKAALGDPGPDNRLKAIKALEFYTPEDVEGNMRAALEDDSAPVRLAALKYLSSHGAPGIAGILIKAGKDEDGEIRKTALETLCRTEGGEAAGALVDYYRGGDAAARYYAFGCLKDRHDPDSRALMADSLKDMEAGIRLMAVDVLGLSGDIKPLYPLALDTDQDVKRAALGFMKNKPEPGMLDVLGKSVEDSDKGIRLMSLDVLGGIDGPDSGRLISGAVDDASAEVRDAARKLVSVRSDEGVVSGLISMLGENSQPVRDEAARLLVSLRGGSVDGVVAAAFPEGKPLARQGMLDVLSIRSPEKVYPLIVAALGDGDPGVRQAAVRAAGKLPGVKRSSAYAAMASYGYPDVRLASASGLEGGDADRILSALLSDTDAGVRRAAAMRLLELRSPLLKDAMPSLVMGADPETARAVFEYAAAHRDADGAVETIVAAVAGPYHEMAATAADIIIEKPDSRAFPAYEALFGRGYRKKAVAEAIAGIPGGAAVDALGKVYRGSSGDEGLRLLAVESLGGRGEFALPYLEEALKDPSDDIRVAAVKSIGTLDNSKAKLDALASAMDDREPVVTHAALTALAGAGSTAGASRMFAALGKVGLSDEAFALIRKMMTPDLFSGASPAGVAGIIDPSARKDAVTLLVDGGCPVDVLMPFLADRSVAVRLEAVRGLSQRSGVDASYGLLLAGADTSADVRAAAGAGLDGRGTDELSNAVELLFGRGMASPDVLRSAAGVLHDVVLLHRLLDGVHKDDTGRLLSVLQPLAERLNAYDVPVLLDGLKAEDHGIRSMIVKSLAKMLPPAGSDALAEAYTRYPSMKGTIIDISAGSVNAGTVLSTALSDSDPVVKLRAAARIKDLSAGPGEKLAISAFKDPDEKVRAEAVRAAGERGYAAIISEAANDPSAYVREGLVKALGGRRKPEDADVLAGLTRDKDGKVSRSALDVLVSEGEGVPAGVWAGLAEPGNSKAVRLAALGEITERKDNAGMELFAASLSDPDKDISGACMAGLAAAGKDAVPVVRGLLSEGKAVRKALDIVVMSSDPSYEPDVVSLTGKSVGEELTAAIRALGEVGGPYGLAALVKAYPGLGTSDKVTALKSVAEMRLTGGEPGLDALLSGALSSPEDDIRFYAARAAGYKSVPALRDKLVEAAGKESSQFVKREIARALDRLEKGGRDTK